MPLPDETFDGVVMTVSIQYITRPIEVFADVGRVLKPGRPFIVTFSNRMFPTKAVWVWQQATEPQRVELVKWYFDDSGMFDHIEAIERHCESGYADPVFAVIGSRRR